MLTADDIIRELKLAPHPNEGGFFRETYRSPTNIPAEALALTHSGARSVSTAIYYLLTPSTFSQVHRLPGDEIFHFYLGDPVEMLQLDPSGDGRIIQFGNDVAAGQTPQVLVPGGVWQGGRLKKGGRFALMGTTMAPGFAYEDYQNGKREDLIAQFPKYKEMIEALTFAFLSPCGRG